MNLIDDGLVLRLFDLVVKCLEEVDRENPHTALRAPLAELKEDLKKIIAEITPK